jgi:Clostripain family
MLNVKKRVIKASIMISLILGGCLITAQATKLQTPMNLVNNPENKAWTTLFYLDNDYTGYVNDALQEIFIDEIASTSNVNVVVIQDNLDDPAVMYYIDENHSAIVLEELGEVNMADPQVLKNFIAYGKEQYPADRYLLWVYNHGGAWKGACLDETDNAIGMTLDNFQKALTDTGGVDVICFLACLMSSLEAAYELRNCVEVLVGSEDLAYGSWFDDICGDTNQLLTDTPEVSNEELGVKIVQFFDESNNPPTDKLTISALRTSAVESLARAIDDVTRYYSKHWFKYYRYVAEAFDNTFLLSDLDEWAKVFEVYDLRGFLENLPPCTKTEAALETFTDVVITEVHGSDMEETHGLSIFFQPNISQYRLYKQYRDKTYGLDFVQDTYWDEFLFLFILSNVLLRK